MAKTELLTVRMDTERFTAFMTACRGLGRPASEITRELIEAFMAQQAGAGSEQIAAGHGVTEEQVLAEGARRREAIRRRIASLK